MSKSTFRIKMHEACGKDDLRPILSTVFFDNGFMVATDAHVMVKAKISDYSSFTPEEIELLNGRFVTRETFKRLYATKQLNVTENGFTDEHGTLYPFYIADGKFPNYNAVIPTEFNPISKIGVSPKVFKKLFNILTVSDYENVVMNFSAENRAITINSISSELSLCAIVMPVMQN